MKKHLWLVFAVLSLFLLVACNDDSNESASTNTDSDVQGDSGKEEAVSSDPVKVGVLASLTGALESCNKQTKNGFELV